MQHSNASPSSLPLVQPHALWAAALLAIMMIITRGHHFASVDTLPSASWAVFFLAGALLRPVWSLPAFWLLSLGLDTMHYGLGNISGYCFSPAYPFLMAAYTALFFAGRWYARAHRDALSTVPRLLLALLLAGSAAYLLSKGGFYFLSGRHDPSIDGFIARISSDYHRWVGPLTGYSAIVLSVVALVRRQFGVASNAQARL